MRKTKYYCDSCKNELAECELIPVEITFGKKKGVQHREVCHKCWAIYTDRVADVVKEMFEE